MPFQRLTHLPAELGGHVPSATTRSAQPPGVRDVTPRAALPPGVIDVTPRSGRCDRCGHNSSCGCSGVAPVPLSGVGAPFRRPGCGSGDCDCGSRRQPSGVTTIEDSAPRPPGSARPPYIGANPLPLGAARYIQPRLPCRFSCGRNEDCRVGQKCCSWGGQTACADDCGEQCVAWTQLCRPCPMLPGEICCVPDSPRELLCRPQVETAPPGLVCDDLGRILSRR